MTVSFPDDVTDKLNGLNSLPSGWSEATVGDTGEFINGLAFKESDWSAEGLPIVRIQNLTNPTKSFNRTTRAVDPVYRIEAGDVLVSWSATLDAFRWNGGPALVNQHIFKVIPNTSIVDPRFQFHLLRWAIAQMRESAHLHGSTMKHINRGPFLAFPILLPPLAEQCRIVAEIDTQFARLDAAEAALERARAKLNNYRAALLSYACSDQLDGPSAFAAMPNSSTSWSTATLGELCERITSGSRAWSQYYGEGNGTFLMAQNVRPMQLDLSYRQPIDPPRQNADAVRSQVEQGDLLVTIVGAGTGDVCQVPRPLPEHYVCQSVALLRPRDPAHSNFLELFLNSPDHGQKQFESFMYGQGRPHLSFEQLRSVKVVLPTTDQQTLIRQRFEELDSAASAMRRTLEAADQQCGDLRQSILQRAFSGQLVPQDPDDEPVSVLLERIPTERASAAPSRRKAASRRTKSGSAEVQRGLL